MLWPNFQYILILSEELNCFLKATELPTSHRLWEQCPTAWPFRPSWPPSWRCWLTQRWRRSASWWTTTTRWSVYRCLSVRERTKPWRGSCICWNSRWLGETLRGGSGRAPWTATDPGCRSTPATGCEDPHLPPVRESCRTRHHVGHDTLRPCQTNTLHLSQHTVIYTAGA